MPPAPPSNYSTFGMYSGMSTVVPGPGFFHEPNRTIPVTVQPIQTTFSPITIPATTAAKPTVSTLPVTTASPDKNLPKTPDAIASTTSQDSTTDGNEKSASTQSPEIKEESKHSEPQHDEIETKSKEPKGEKTEEESDKGQDSKKESKTNRSNQHQSYNRRQFSGWLMMIVYYLLFCYIYPYGFNSYHNLRKYTNRL